MSAPGGLRLSAVQVRTLPSLLSKQQGTPRGFLSAIIVLFMVGCVFVPKAILDSATEQWGIKVARVEIKDVRIPVAMQRAMAAEAEAAREARAKVRPTAMSTPKLLYPCPRHPNARLFSPHCEGGFLQLWAASQCHFSYFAGCGSRGRNECFQSPQAGLHGAGGVSGRSSAALPANVNNLGSRE